MIKVPAGTLTVIPQKPNLDKLHVNMIIDILNAVTYKIYSFSQSNLNIFIKA